MADGKLAERPDPERYRRTLANGILVFRWVWLLWMSGLAITSADDFIRPLVAWASIGLGATWTAWLTATRHRPVAAALWIDLVVCSWLVLASGLVLEDGAVISGRPFFATGYALSAPLLWGAARGVRSGFAAALVLGFAHVMTRPLNGVGLDDLSGEQFQNLAGAVLNYIVAGVATGIVSRVLVRSARDLAEASENLMRARERAARLAEREKLARHIHDSVLQSLSYVHKRGRELAGHTPIAPDDVAELAQLAARQETELRGLILRDPEEAPVGRGSLREALEAVAREVEGVGVSVSSVGPIWWQRHRIEEVTAAVRQALENVVRHSGASTATVFAERDDGMVTVSVRDDGAGFVYDEERLRAAGKAGMLKSMKGRAQELGGSMQVTTAPGSGTEIELRIPEGDDS